MKRVPFDRSWPTSVKESHHYDMVEFWGDTSNLGYTYAYRNRFGIALDLVSRSAGPPARVLDVAAAQGSFSLKLAELGYQVVWNDLRSELAAYVRLKHEAGNVEYRPGNIFDMSPDDIGKFSVVLATEIIEHCAHPDEFLRKLATFLDEDGRIVITTPNGGYFRNGLPRFSDCSDPSVYEAVQFKPNSDGHIFLLHADEVVSLADKAGLAVETVKLFTNPLTAGHVKTRLLLRLLPRGVVEVGETLTRALPLPIQRVFNVHIAAFLRRMPVRSAMTSGSATSSSG